MLSRGVANCALFCVTVSSATFNIPEYSHNDRGGELLQLGIERDRDAPPAFRHTGNTSWIASHGNLEYRKKCFVQFWRKKWGN